MYHLETNPIEKDIKRFFKEADNNHVRFKVTLHTETIDIPIYRMLNKDIKLRLRSSTVNVGLPPNVQGWGMINIKKLLT